MDKPYGLLAELTYACPLKCGYCSNPLQLDDYRDELGTEEWKRVFAEAADLGVLQLHLSGGEPLQRHDIVELVRSANRLGLYTNLITSGLGLSRSRAAELREAGLDHVQLSIQSDEQPLSDHIAGTPSFARKQVVAKQVKDLGWPLTLNVVLHRLNIDRIAGIIAMAEAMNADRIELANTQYAGWAGINQPELLPSRGQLDHAEVVVREARERLEGSMEIIYVIPDYYSDYPKPCMDGWAARQFTVVPNGDALPCPAAHELAVGHGIPSANVREHSLGWIWDQAPLFQAFRGDSWMPDPCRSCERKEIDFGGCRCQAFALTGDAARTDPVCHLSPDHGLIEAAVATANDPGRPAGGILIPRATIGRPNRAMTVQPRRTTSTPVRLSPTMLRDKP
ncbi:pyrroloquinoline quinone biosynthesis protein PqqE [Paenarthrobacter nitroguajacolicus]|uniref:pyrroloquinoline quinone biosynthesis protein PqqE n=1 Tax=Paenarthrobacter nitroguajacolicus TaxID=211146 RepID=UPI0028587898|nr:pyrroloquinoline quinone biosynthesis protein PqqE [Paenarthrobacter nitroguajacolicus]MDR6639822.1 pyrroloquinoline quinone biosynthesis protein E [Paenarthrobacter nitroguajacolicus]